jgi:hypothetical protein
MYSYTLTLSVVQIVFLLVWLAVLLWHTHAGCYYSGKNAGLDFGLKVYNESWAASIAIMRAETAAEEKSTQEENSSTEARP